MGVNRMVWQPVDPVVGTQFDKITAIYEIWEVLSPPSVHFNRELLPCVYICTYK